MRVQQHRKALSLRQAAALYGIAPRRLSTAIYAGQLPAGRLGKRDFKILESDLDDWIRKQSPYSKSRAEAVVERVIRARRERSQP